MFDLGLALSFQDNASRGLKNVVGTMQDLTESVNEAMGKLEEFSRIEMQTGKNLSAMKDMAMGTLLTQVGGVVTDTGKSMGNVLTGAMSSIVDVSKEVKSARITIDNLWGGAEKGAEAFNKMKEYAMTSTFEFKDLLSTMTMMKAVGIDINDNLSTTSGKTQKITDYAGDLAALFPDMRNMYGTGIRAAMGAIKEFVAEGNTRSLLTGAGLDIQTILGEKKGGDIKTRSRQIADLIEKINAFGMTANMMGQPAQRLSNLSDILFNLQYQMSESGKVYEKYSEFIKNLTEPLMKIDDKQWQELGKSLGGAFDVILNPLVTLSKYIGELIPKFVEFIKQNPALVKIVITLGTLISAGLILAGTLLTLGGSIRLMQFAYKGLIPLQKGFLTFLRTSNMLSKATLISFGQWAVAAYIVYQAFQHNFGGIKDLLTDVFTVASAVFQVLSSGKLNRDDYNYLKSRDLLDLVDSLALFGTYLEEMFKGIGEGIKSAGMDLIDFLDSFSEFTGIDLSATIKWIKDFMNSFSKSGDMKEIARIRDVWKDFGKVIGEFIIPLLLLKPLLSIVVGGIWKVAKGFIWLLSKVPVAKKIFGSVWEFINGKDIGVAIMKLATKFAKSEKIMYFIFKHFGMQGSKLVIELMQGLWKEAAKTFLRLAYRGISIALSRIKTFIIQRIWQALVMPLVSALASFFGISVAAMGGILIAALVVIGGLIYLTVTGKWGEVNKWLEEHVGEPWIKFRDACKQSWDDIISWWNNFDFWQTAFGRFLTGVSDTIRGWGDSLKKLNLNKPLVQVIREKNAERQVNARVGFDEPPDDHVRFATGGETRGEGFAYLHPNEAILNSGLTKKLGEFLAVSRASAPANVTYGDTHISIYVDHMDNDTDLNALAEKLMKIMERKMQLKRMAVRA